MEKLDFEKMLLQQANTFGESLGTILGSLGNFRLNKIVAGQLTNQLSIKNDYIVSISFVGMVTGEFIISVSKDDVKKLFPSVCEEDEIRATLAESLNMVAGGRITELSMIFGKLTITAPKILSGEIRYPTITNISFSIQGDDVSVQGYLYIDRMRLDLADSYGTVMAELQNANSELLQANVRLQHQQAQLIHSEKMASLGIMAAGVAHEINNPLAFVSSNNDVLDSYIKAMTDLLVGYEHLLELLNSKKPEEAKSEFIKITEMKRKEDINFILTDTRKLLSESKYGLNRIKQIVTGLRRFSRVDESEMKLVNINQEIENTLMLLQNEIKFRCKTEVALNSTKNINCYPGEIAQVLVNLIMNSLQAMDKEDSILTVKTEDGPNSLSISIQDNGKGIAAENLAKIFNPFFTTKPVGEGTGLGLAISYGIIQKHKGKISVRSEVGQGTTFTIELPFTS